MFLRAILKKAQHPRYAKGYQTFYSMHCVSSKAPRAIKPTNDVSRELSCWKSNSRCISRDCDVFREQLESSYLRPLILTSPCPLLGLAIAQPWLAQKFPLDRLQRLKCSTIHTSTRTSRMEAVTAQQSASGAWPDVSVQADSEYIGTALQLALEGMIAQAAGHASQTAAPLPNKLCQQLLEDEPSPVVEETASPVKAAAASFTPSPTQRGVLPRPLLHHLAWGLLQWNNDSHFSVLLPRVDGLQEDRSWEAELDRWMEKVQAGIRGMLEARRKAVLSLNVQEPWFSHLKSGVKSVEGRCAKEAYLKLTHGDIVLVNGSLLLRVKGVTRYDSFATMLEAEGVARVVPGCTSIHQGCAVYRAFYSEEQEQARGVVAIHVEPCAEDTQPVHRMTELLREIGSWPLLLLLRMRRTAGSIPDALSPPRTTMLAAFAALHDPTNRLSVGARALSKHAHRCSHNWWGVPTGSEQAKNDHARGIVLKILDEAVWQNVHLLPHDVAVFEARVAEGYGARWTADGTQFRGFLEPQMEDGHQRGWRH